MQSSGWLNALLTVALVIHGSQGQQADLVGGEEKYPNYENPVRSSADDEVKNLPGLNDSINFKHYSGFLRGDDAGTRFLHYWFMESQNDPVNDPVLLWTGEGPGCSSLSGLFAEIGPFEINENGKTLMMRETSWNKMANVLFLDSPTGVGFSYNKKTYKPSDDTTAVENHMALRSFFEKFPQYKNSSLYLASEYYGGVYLLTLGLLIDADPELNLKGIAIGNGYLDACKITDTIVFFTYHHGILGNTTWNEISKECCNGEPPSPDSCVLSGENLTRECKGALFEIGQVLGSGGLNLYNLYSDCRGTATDYTRNEGHPAVGHLSSETVNRALLELAMDPKTCDFNESYHVFEATGKSLGTSPTCTKAPWMAKYINTKSVKKALNIPKELNAWDICNFIRYKVQYPTLPGGLKPQMQKLIDSKRNLTMLIFNGDVNVIGNFMDGEWFVDGLNREVISDYTVWKVENQVAGFVQHHKGVTFATVKGAGMMVPEDKPREAFEMIKIFLNSTGHNVYL